METAILQNASSGREDKWNIRKEIVVAGWDSNFPKLEPQYFVRFIYCSI